MINMMYLVLTALLALNVSSEILNAFKTVNKSLETTNTTVNKSTEQILASLKEKMNDPSKVAKAQIWLPKAEQAQAFSKTVFSKIQELKDRILREAGGDPSKPDQKFKEDNLDIATRIMVEKGEGPKLLAMLTEYKKNILGIDPSIDSAFKNVLPLTWRNQNPVTGPVKHGKGLTSTWYLLLPLLPF
jgi:gliding motility-associated protein GldM